MIPSTGEANECDDEVPSVVHCTIPTETTISTASKYDSTNTTIEYDLQSCSHPEIDEDGIENDTKVELVMGGMGGMGLITPIPPDTASPSFSSPRKITLTVDDTANDIKGVAIEDVNTNGDSTISGRDGSGE